MNDELLQRFLEEELNDHVRQILLRRVSECRSGTAFGQQTFEFNRFNVIIDCERNMVTVEDELNPEPTGQGCWPLEEFAAVLWR